MPNIFNHWLKVALGGRLILWDLWLPVMWTNRAVLAAREALRQRDVNAGKLE